MTRILMSEIQMPRSVYGLVVLFAAVVAVAATGCSTASADTAATTSFVQHEPAAIADGLATPIAGVVRDAVRQMAPIAVSGCRPEAGCERIGCSEVNFLGTTMELCVGANGAPVEERVRPTVAAPTVAPIAGPVLATAK